MKKNIFLLFLLVLSSCKTQYQNTIQNDADTMQVKTTEQENQFTHLGEATKIAGLYTLDIPKSFSPVQDVDNSYDTFYTNDDAQMGFFSLHFSPKDIGEVPLDILLDKTMSSYNVQLGGNISQMIENPYKYEVFDKKYVGKNDTKDAVFYVRAYKFSDAYILYAVFSHPDYIENNIGSIFQLISSFKK